MYPLNPLYEFFIEESFNKIVRRFNRYDVSKQPKLLNWLIKQNKKYHPDNYGKLMLKGQETRIDKLSKQAGRKVHISRVDDPLHSKIMINGVTNSLSKLPSIERVKISNGYDVIRLPHINSKISKDTINSAIHDQPNLKDSFIKSFKNQGNSKLTNASQASHEADEFSNIIKQSKRLNLTPDSYAAADAATRLPHEIGPSHYRGNVLSREFKRQRKLDTVFGKGSSFNQPRSQLEIDVSRKPLENAYNDYIKQNPDKENNVLLMIQKAVDNYKRRSA